MTHLWHTTLIALALATSCGSTICGKGTKQVQNQQTGNSECVPVDAVNPEPCVDNADAGTVIVGGRCVSAVACDPTTSKPVRQPDGTYLCVGTGGAGKQ